MFVDNWGKTSKRKRCSQGLSGAQLVLNCFVVAVGHFLWDNASASCHFLFLTVPRAFHVQGSLPFPPSLTTSGVCSTASEYHLYVLNDQMFSVALLPKLGWRVQKNKGLKLNHPGITLTENDALGMETIKENLILSLYTRVH